VRMGTAPDYDRWEGFNFERGRQFAILAPASLQIRARSGKGVSRAALEIMRRGIADGSVI